MSDTNNNEVTPAATNSVVQPTPASTPSVMPVQNAAPVVSSVPQTPVAPVVPATPVVTQPQPTQQPPVAINVPQTQPANVAAPVGTQAAPAANPMPTVGMPNKEEIGSERVLFTGPVETKTVDSLASDLAVADDSGSSSNKKDSTGQTTHGDDFVEEKESKKLPVTVLAIFLCFLVIISIYYFIVMTPTRIFDYSINSVFENIKSRVNAAKNGEESAKKYIIKAIMETGGETNKFLDGIIFNAELLTDIKNLEFGLSLENEVGDTALSEADIFDSKVYIKDGGIYVTNKELSDAFPGKVALYSDSDIMDVSYDRADSIISILEKFKDDIIDSVKSEQLSRKIATKKINGQTTVALKLSCSLNSKEISDIAKGILKKYLKDEKFIKQISDAVGTMSPAEVKEEINRLYEMDSIIRTIDVNLYMNLANTQLVSLDITVDDFFVEIDNLNGYFYGSLKHLGAKDSFDDPEFYIQFEYDAYNGLLNGTGRLDKEDQVFTYLIFDYSKTMNDSEVQVGNSLHINFFNKEVKGSEEYDKNYIIARLDCTLEIDEDNPTVVILGKKESIDKTEEIEKGINESISRLMHYVNYVNRNLYYNSLSDNKYASEMRKLAIEKRVESQVKNKETTYLDVSDIKSEVQKAKDYCSKNGTYAYLHSGASKTTGQFDGFPMIDGAIFDWICLYGELTDKEEKELNFESPSVLDYTEIDKIINDKLTELDVKVTKKAKDIENITVTPTNIELKVGESFKILSAYEPSDATKTKLTWKSADVKKATVTSEGEVKAVSVGTVKISVTSESGKSASTIVKITE